jgi:hypothetical protein
MFPRSRFMRGPTDKWTEKDILKGNPQGYERA